MGMNRTFFSFKEPDEIEELRVIHPYALLIFSALVKYCYDVGFPAPIITCMARTIDEDEALGAESNSHRTLRAFDISSKIYNAKQIKDIQAYLTKHYGQWGAVNGEGKIRLVVYHKVDASTWHMHLQVHSRFTLPEFTGIVPV